MNYYNTFYYILICLITSRVYSLHLKCKDIIFSYRPLVKACFIYSMLFNNKYLSSICKADEYIRSGIYYIHSNNVVIVFSFFYLKWFKGDIIYKMDEKLSDTDIQPLDEQIKVLQALQNQVNHDENAMDNIKPLNVRYFSYF